MKTKSLRSCHARKKQEKRDKNGVKENLQMEKIWIKTEDWHTPPLLNKKKNATTYDYLWMKHRRRSEKKQPRKLRLIAPDTIGTATGDIIGVGFRAGCAVLKKIELKVDVGLEPQVGASRLENDTLVVLLLLLGGRRLEGSNDCLDSVNDAVLTLRNLEGLTSSKTSLSLS
jgi:hypothetical protein